MIVIVLLTIVVFAVAMTFLALGVILRGRSLRGHCGGEPRPVGPDGEVLTCDDCTCQGQQVIPPESLTLKEE